MFREICLSIRLFTSRFPKQPQLSRKCECVVALHSPVRRLRAGLIGDERGPLLGQPHELVRRVVEAGVHAVLEVGRRRYLHLLLLLGEHFGTMRAVVGFLSSLQSTLLTTLLMALPDPAGPGRHDHSWQLS